ncbi:MAG: TolB family protein [Bacteroidia bacterium]
MKNLLLLFLLLCAGCKKEPKPTETIPSDDCYELDADFFDERWDGVERKSTEKDAQWPCICPFDKNRIVYLMTDGATGKRTLKIQNMQTGEAHTLMDRENILYNFSWSVKDWILFPVGNSAIYKIKSNGDSLQQLLGIGYSNPLWSPKGDKFLVHVGSGTVLVSENGEILKKFTGLNPYIWSPHNNNLVATYKREGNDFFMATYDIETDKTIKIISPKDIHGEDCGNEFVWADSLNIIWGLRGKAIYKTNLQTKTTKKLRDQCKYMAYSFYTMFPGDKFFYADRLDYKYVNDTPWVETNIWRISIDGKNVTKIDVK